VIPRLLEKTIRNQLIALHKIVLVYGARQVGKTTLMQSMQKEFINEGKKVRYLNCDLDEERNAINSTAHTLLSRLVGGQDAVLIDEAQRLDNPGLTLKILFDQFPKLTIVATGSSSFDLRNRVSDALTGRYLDYHLPPLSLHEALFPSGFSNDPGLQKSAADALLPDVLLYGLYPEIFLEGNSKNKQVLLSRLVESYLFKDILTFNQIRFSQTIVDLARALAYQIGNQVSELELANRLRIDRKTVVNYIDILEKSFVIFRLPPFSRNPRQEIGKQNKIYFWDTGIRNALIGDFNSLDLRPDRGALWENFLIVEKIKTYLNRGETIRARFWRNYKGAEVDYIEEAGQMLKAYEIKYGEIRDSRGAEAFERVYKMHVEFVKKENYWEFLQWD